MSQKKVYLDTSVISYLKEEDSKEKMEETLFLWDSFINDNEYLVYVSTHTINEISECSEPKRSFMFDMLKKINYIKLEATDEILELRNKYLDHKVLTGKSKDDLLHIAFAVANSINCIVSWNFKHFVNLNTIKSVNATNILFNHITVNIVTPPTITGGVNNDS